MKKFIVIPAVIFLACITAYNQSLGDLGREEQKRRESISAEKITVMKTEPEKAPIIQRNDSSKQTGKQVASPFAEMVDAFKELFPKEMADAAAEMADAYKEVFSELKDIISNSSPAEKAIYRKVLEDDYKNRRDLYDVQLKKQLNSMDKQERKEFEETINDFNYVLEDGYRNAMKELGL